MKANLATCRICRQPGAPAGSVRGRRWGRTFSLSRCGHCGFAWVENPLTDFAAIYDEAYYRGEGSDPSVDYAFEFDHPDRTIRRAEWNGVLRVVQTLAPDARHWLDFGCGTGGLVRYVATHAPQMTIHGFDTGAWARRARTAGIAVLDEREIQGHSGHYDVVTAIEVIEHVVDPIPLLQEIRKLLRPGGLLFLTTANAACAPQDLTRWGYVAPEIHVSYFTPTALRLALESAGFAAEFPGGIDGYREILRYRILKGLHQRPHRFWHDLVPWRVAAPLADKIFGLSAHPVGRAIEPPRP